MEEKIRNLIEDIRNGNHNISPELVMKMQLLSAAQTDLSQATSTAPLILPAKSQEDIPIN